MDAPTILVLTVQLTALFSIAGALLLYLLCKVRGQDATTKNGRDGSVLITSADTALGLQLSTYLANKGCRVFAGMKDPDDSLPAKLLKGWMKTREDAETPVNGSIVLFKIDVTREDVLREATDAMGAYLNAGERGISAVINTSGSVHRGRIEQQESAQWENMLKSNVLGCLRITRAFIGLLRPTRGRFIFLGCGNNGDGLVAFTATRNAVEGCANALREELKPFGIDVVTLDSSSVPAEALFSAPLPYSLSGIEGTPTQYSAEVLTQSALNVIDHALWDARPYNNYTLAVQNPKFQCKLPCRSSLKLRNDGPPPKTVQTV